MASLGVPVLIGGPAGLWLLAHDTAHGLQPTFYNWPDLAEAIAFCKAHRESPKIEVGRHRMTPTMVAALAALHAGAGTVGQIAKAMDTKPAIAAGALRNLGKRGLVQVGAEGGATKAAAEAWLTVEGAEVARQLAAT